MKHLRRWLVACAVILGLLLAAAAGLWLVYGESVRVLAGLITASGENLPPGVTRQPLILVSGEATVHADIYEPAEPRAVLLFVPGLTSAGKEDSRVLGVSGVLAGAGFRVVTPDLPGAMTLSAGRQDAAVLGLLLDHLVVEQDGDGLPLGVVAVSYGLGPALAAAAPPERAQGIAMVLGLGGYHDGSAIVSYATTGWFTDPRDGVTRMGHPDPRARWLLLYSLLEHVPSMLDRNRLAELARVGSGGAAPGLVAITRAMAQGGPDARAILGLIANTELERVDPLIEALPAEARDDLTALSPSRLDLAALQDRLVLVHGEKDPVIPYSESLRLADAVPGSRVYLIPGFSHVEPGATGIMGQIAMIRAVRVLLSLRR